MDARASSLPPHICHTFATCLPYTSSLKPPQELPSRTAEGDVIIVGDIITVGDVITVDDVITGMTSSRWMTSSIPEALE